MNRASWTVAPTKPPRPERSVYRRSTVPDAERCVAHSQQWVRGIGGTIEARCLNVGLLKAFDGKRYCRRHHPVKVAETQAYRLAAHIAALEQAGFTVQVRR